MVRHQDDTSFLSWTATLHPESAMASSGVSSTTRNPLEVVYHEIASDDVYFDGLPVAVQVVTVDNDDDQEQLTVSANQQLYTSTRNHTHNGHTALSHQDQEDLDETMASGNVYRPKPWRHSNAIDLVLGFVLAFCAWITTVKLEVTAFVVYAMAAFFHVLAEKVFGQTSATLLCKSIFSIVTAVLMIVDSVLIMVSVLVTEIMGALALILCTVFGGPRSGTEWHMFIRRTCHLTRWGFRSCMTMGWKPERIFPISESAESASLQPRPTAINHEMSRQQQTNSQSSMSEYRDVVAEQAALSQLPVNDGGTRSTSCGYDTNNSDVDDTTTISTLTTATVLPSEMPPVTVAAEHVHVLAGENFNENDDDGDGYFTKNTQEVTID
ncbi:hypothetical protein IV203_022134 [Nitzschia inconspicua]|uniref:Transmembrane protein n=1 Tax=Nitzschia inconspicua TaxID=303405 RepID=A0A9K3PER8_9STRA|nr:hypothetical protein IV203_022134 [Nitzschia inconspicua]